VTASGLITRRGTRADLDALVPLFDGYRQFYEQPEDLSLARSFLEERFERGDSVILVVDLNSQLVGFTQLFGGISSIKARRTYRLNDLFVTPDVRRSGAGEALLEAAKAFAAGDGAVRLTLSTALDNVTAQSVYERNGWVRDEKFYVYDFDLRD
jgi:GNAT superfamily N-acetyltransferase